MVGRVGRCFLLLAVLQAGLVRAAPPSTAETRSIELTRDAEVAYRAGRFDEAELLLVEAYKLNAEPIIQYNLARALEGKGDLRAAIESYQRYLHDAGDIADRRLIEARIGAIEREIQHVEEARQRAAEQERAAATAKKRAEEAEALARSAHEHTLAERRAERRRADHRRFVAAWSLAGVGGAVLVTGAGLGGGAAARRDDADQSPNALVADERFHNAEKLAAGANVCFGVGGVLTAAGVVWGIVETVRHRREARAQRSAASWALSSP